MQLSISTNLDIVDRALKQNQRQASFALAVALTRTAQDVRRAEVDEMRRVFDRPTAYTLGALFVRPATKATLMARVWLKDDRASAGTPATNYLLPQILGRSRRLKGFERLLQRAGRMPVGSLAVPGVAAKLDASGNVSRSQLRQVVGQLKLQAQAGDRSKVAGRKRSTMTIAKTGRRYFTLTQAHGKLQPGLYERSAGIGGGAVRPVLLFVGRASYAPRFRFAEVGERVFAQRFPAHFETAWRAANASSK